jgi:hypothetical protein
MTLDAIRTHLSEKYGNTHHFLGSIELQNVLVIRNRETHRAITVVRKHGEFTISRGGLCEPETVIGPVRLDSLDQIDDWLN